MKKGVPLTGRDGVAIAIVTIAASIVLKLFVLDACRIASPSMVPSLLPGDYVFFSRVSFSLPPFLRRVILLTAGIPAVSSSVNALPRRGDIVVFEAPDPGPGVDQRHGTLYVKRCIGLPGDTVEIRRGILRVGATELGRIGDGRSGQDFGPCVVPSRGSRIAIDQKSAAWWRPLVEGEGHRVSVSPGGRYRIDGIPASEYVARSDYLFVLGDNVENSSDSRSWGPLALDRVRGQAVLTFWSRDPGSDRRGFFDRLGHTRWDRVGMLIH